MKATGIVRRIDDLGRVVIPKEIRRTQRIREGDPLEIFISADGEVIFKKYSPIGELSTIAAQCADVLSKNIGMTVLICDREQIIATAGSGKKDLLDKRISMPLVSLLEQRKSCILQQQQYPCEDCNKPIAVVAPIVVQGDVIGGTIVLQGETEILPAVEQQAVLTAAFLAKQIEP